MIGIIDYGMGNIRAFANIYKNLNIPHKVVHTIDEFEGVTKIILPGVGAFDYAMTQLANSGLLPELNTLVVEQKYPVLGICVGMQMLAKNSEEGKLPGLNWLDAGVSKFDKSKLERNSPLPHMGWNTIKHKEDSTLFNDISQDSRFYFLHSYFFKAHNNSNIIATSNYGDEFTCAVSSENVFGVQFHPEKSHKNGVQLLKNFAKL